MWPALSECFELHPWDVGRLSIAEVSKYIDALPETLNRRTLNLKL